MAQEQANIIQNNDNFIFVFSPIDMKDFFDDWPEKMYLAVHHNDLRESYYILPEENMETDIERLSKGKTIPVFPPMNGLPTLKVSFQIERDVVGRVENRRDLLQNAKEIKKKVDNYLESNEGDDFSDLDDGWHDEGNKETNENTNERRDKEVSLNEEEGNNPLNNQAELQSLQNFLLSSIAKDNNVDNPSITMNVNKDCISFRVDRALFSQEGEEGCQYCLSMDGEGKRFAIMQQEILPVGMEGMHLNKIDMGLNYVEFVIYTSDVDSLLLKKLRNVDNKNGKISLLGYENGIIVGDISEAYRVGKDVKANKLTKISMASMVIIMLFMSGYIAVDLSIGSVTNMWSNFTEEEQDMQSREYVERMMGEWFPD